MAQLARLQIFAQLPLRFLKQRRLRRVLELVSGVLEIKAFPECLLKGFLGVVIYKHHVLGLGDHGRLFSQRLLCLLSDLVGILSGKLRLLLHLLHRRLICHLQVIVVSIRLGDLSRALLVWVVQVVLDILRDVAHV